MVFLRSYFKKWFAVMTVLVLCMNNRSFAQTYNFNTSSASEIEYATDMKRTGHFPDTLTVWDNDWWYHIRPNLGHWGDSLKFKSLASYVKFQVYHEYQHPSTTAYNYRITYQLLGYTNPADTVSTYTTINDTLTIGYNPDSLSAYQDIQLKRYTGFYKIKAIITGLYDYTNPSSPHAVTLSTMPDSNFFFEASILTQDYNKFPYGSTTSLVTGIDSSNVSKNYLGVSWQLSSGASGPIILSPVNYELEWTYVDDYARNLSTGAVTYLSPSQMAYDFRHNSTRVWLDTNYYQIPLVYPGGAVVYRVRMVRPDSILYKYPIYSAWSVATDSGSVSSTGSTNYYYIWRPYTSDSLNWQYTVSFAEGGKYKNVLSFYDGLLKNRESITRFNSNPNNLIVTQNVYDYEGRPSIKILPTPVNVSSFNYQHNVSLNANTHLPYQASDFDTLQRNTCPGEPMIAPLDTNALASIYYSHRNPDIASVPYEKFVPDAQGYPLIETIYDPSFNDRVLKQGGAGPLLQVADSNVIQNEYVNADQEMMNRYFGLNIGNSAFYTKIMSQDPNRQQSLSIKDYKGKQILSSMVGTGPSSLNHAIVPLTVPNPTWYTEDLIAGTTQEIIGNQRILDKGFYMDAGGVDTAQYIYSYTPFQTVCPGLYLTVKASYHYQVNDQCGNLKFQKDGVLGVTGVTSSSAAVPFTGSKDTMSLNKGPQTVHKTLTVHYNDVVAAVDSFMNAPNCLIPIDSFIRQSVESRTFPCPFNSDDECAKKKAQMLTELFPGAKYGNFSYYMGPDGRLNKSKLDSNSIFTSYDTIYPGTTNDSFYCRYQNSCIVTMPAYVVFFNDTIRNLSTMRLDSFIAVYNYTVANGDYSIATALLPLHPEYCQLQNCYTDTFKNTLLALPSAQVAMGLNLFSLDSIAKQDPLVAKMQGSPYFIPDAVDSLKRFPGGKIRLDSLALMKAYCGCSDSVQFNECVSHIFNKEISTRILTNAFVQNSYFTDIIQLYLQNREKFKDEITGDGGTTCMPCSAARMTLKPVPVFPTYFTSTGGLALGSGAWTPFTDTSIGIMTTLLSSMTSDSLSADSLAKLEDSTTKALTHLDSVLTLRTVDSILGHLPNCTQGNLVLTNNLRTTLDSFFSSGAVHDGNFTPSQVRFALVRNAIPLTDLCNPYLINYDYFGPAAMSGGGGCKDQSYYNAIQSFLNQSAIKTSFVNAAQTSPSTPAAYTLSATSTFETAISALTGSSSINVFATYQPAHNFYTLYVYKPSSPIDTVKIYLRGGVGCVNSYHPNKASDTFNISSVACVSSVPGANTLGYINDLSFIATLQHTSYGVTTSCSMLGWTDSVETMDYSLNPISATVPCTQMRSLFTQLQDSMAVYGLKGMDHPFYDGMLQNFMSFNLQQSYSADQIHTFITSCALADSVTIPNYVAYATLVFSNSGGLALATSDTFVAHLAFVDPLAFVNPYREKDASGNITVQVDFNQFPAAELYKYSSFINGYSATGVTKYLNQPLSNTQAANTLGYIYYPPAYTFHDTASVIFNTASTNVSFSAPITKSIWSGGRFITQTYKTISYVAATPAYELSKDIYQLHSYIYNHSIPLTFTSNLESTVNNDYFKPQKTAYLQAVYKYQSLPPYEVLDSLQAIFLQQRIALFNSDFLSYTKPFDPTTITNLYIADPTANSHYYDTLKTIFNLVGAGGSIFFTSNSQMIAGNLYAYRCSDGTYWYRYFGKGDTLYNAYVQLPAYIKVASEPLYHVTSVGTLPGVQPIPGDSTSRFFVLNLQIGTDTTTRIQATGMTDFVIAKNIELDNVLMGSKLVNNASYAPQDTFNNCERTTLRSAVAQGRVNYYNYIDSIRRYETLAFMDALMNGVNEQLFIGYRDQDFNYTLYYYDRADNLIQTIPPAGVHPLDTNVRLLAKVDTVRTAGLDTGTVLYPKHQKISTYVYSATNQLSSQTTPDGGRTDFYYDVADRLVFSQNDKQLTTGNCTYNLYDALGRIIETGEIPNVGGTWGRPFTVSSSKRDSTITALGTKIFSTFYNRPANTYTFCPFPDWITNSNSPNYTAAVEKSYIHGYNRNDVVMTIYDTAAAKLNLIPGIDSQLNLRKRIACVKYFKTIASSDTPGVNYTYATHYSYDVDGNVKMLVQDFPALKNFKYQRYKRVDYDYDLISGKVNMLSYNRGFPDQYYQQYNYDADNRIISVQTSNDGLIWKNDASYLYYEHGPLARVVLGDQKVQGLDYAYTIQGWLKALNGDTLNTSMDMGGDGIVNNIVSKDVVAHSIDYFTGDYTPIGTQAVTHVPGPTLNLYNGNISRQTEAIGNFMRLSKQYIYDQLNRINNTAYASINSVNNTLTGLKDYSNSYKYDADGNLQMLTRYGNSTKTGGTLASPVLMDSLTYFYPFSPVTNRLRQVTDQAANSYTNDIAQFTDTTKNRYIYDAVGNTIKDQVSGQDTIQWNLYNKVTYTSNSTAKNNMTFVYDGAGNRVAKYVAQSNDSGSTNDNDYYVRDAQGNILATYHETQQYKVQRLAPLAWVSATNTDVRGRLSGGSHVFNGDWTVPTYSTDGNFTGTLMSESVEYPAFVSGQLSSPVSEFMSHSSAVYTNMLMNSASWVIPATQYDVLNPSVPVLATPLNKLFSVSNSGLGVPFLTVLFGNPNPSMNQYALGLMCSSGDMTLINALAVLLGQPTDQVCTNEATRLRPVLPPASTLMGMFHTLQQQHPTQFLSYMTAVSTDATLYADQYYSGALPPTLQPIVNTYGIHNNVTAFFDSWTGGHSELTTVNSTNSLLTVKYNESALTYVNAFDDGASDAAVDSAIASVSGLDYNSYVSAITIATGITPNALPTQNVLQKDNYYLAEHDLYGSSRLGIKQYYASQVNASYDYTTTPAKADTLRLFNTVPWYSLEYQDDITAGDVNLYGNTLSTAYGTQHQAGQRQYEITDHLGDVLATVSDKRRGIDPGHTGNITNYIPSPLALYDYYPFGMLMPGRYVYDTANHCELVTETAPVLTSSYLGRLTLGTFCAPCSFVPMGLATLGFGSGSMTVTSSAIGDGASMDVSTVSGTAYSGSVTVSGMSGGNWTLQAIDITSSTILAATTVAQPQTASLNFTAIGPSTRVTMTSTAASSLFTITAIPLNFTTWTAGTIVTTVCSKGSDKYPRGFNGQMKVNEIAGVGNYYDLGERPYDPRTGRVPTQDPLFKKAPGWSPYAFAFDNPIMNIDRDGAWGEDARGKFYEQMGVVAVKVLKEDGIKNSGKALYLLAEYRQENKFNTSPKNNNPFNVKSRGDEGRNAFMTHEHEGGKNVKQIQSFGNFSSVEEGFKGYLNTLKTNFPDAYSALTDDNKTITDFAKGLTNGTKGGYATDPNYADKVAAIFAGVVKDFKKEVLGNIDANNKEIATLQKQIKGEGDADTQKSAQEAIGQLKDQNTQLNSQLQDLNNIK